MMESQTNKVQVVVRVRPSAGDSENTWVQAADSHTLHTVNHRNIEETLRYEFDHVFGEDATQQEVYSRTVKPLLNDILNGRNASVLAYGPTGAGKTYTMLGPHDQPGIISRCVRHLFELINAQRSRLNEHTDPEWSYEVYLSYLEIYNEKVLDLLEPKGTDLPIREDQKKQIFISGLTERPISNVQQFTEAFGPASANRTTASTKLNERSSRSHSIVLLKVKKKQLVAPHRCLHGKLYLIDLAGSEDNRRTGNQGIRLKESGAINYSLHALSNVVDALKINAPVIPYRLSKLTRLLQDSLGGTCRSCMIINIAPEEKHYLNTHNTLLFARKSKKIINREHTYESYDSSSKGRCLKRTLSTEEVGKPKAMKTATSPPPSMMRPPFISPLLRKQDAFENKMVNRLENLEKKLLLQMSGNQSMNISTSDKATHNATSTAVVEIQEEPDSTTHQDGDGDTSNPLDSTFTVLSDENVSCSSDNQSNSTDQHTSDTDKHSNDTEPQTMSTDQHSITTGTTQVSQKKLDVCRQSLNELLTQQKSIKGEKIFSDGSSSKNAWLHREVTSSPLFAKPAVPFFKRKGFQSCAVQKSEAQEKNKENEANADESHFNGEFQQKHNEAVLKILNTGSIKELQGLQTVGAKRAKLIHDWRNLNGTLLEFEDMKKITGLTPKFIDKFLVNNLVKLDQKN